MTPHPLDSIRMPGAAAAIGRRWAQALGLPVQLAPMADNILLPDGPPPRAVAHFDTLHGPLDLHVQTHLLAGVVQSLALARARPFGPVPLSQVELGFFAWLAMDALAAVPELNATLLGARAENADALGGLARGAAWRAQIGTARGLVVWTSLPLEQNRAAGVPIALTVTGHLQISSAHLTPGTCFSMRDVALHLIAGPTRLCELELRRKLGVFQLHLAEIPTAGEGLAMLSSPETLPCTLTLELGSLVLPAGAVAALSAGDRLPIALGAAPRVLLRAGHILVAEGALVTLSGETYVQLLRVFPSPIDSDSGSSVV